MSWVVIVREGDEHRLRAFGSAGEDDAPFSAGQARAYAAEINSMRDVTGYAARALIVEHGVAPGV